MASFQILTNIDKRGLVKSFGSGEEILKRGNAKGTVTIYPNHTISFEIYPTGTVNDWSNVLRFNTNEENCTTQGDRSPGLWFYANTLKLYPRYGKDGDGIQNFDWGISDMTTQLTKFQWNKIDLVVQNQSAKDDMVLLVFINGQFAMEQSLQGFRSWIKPEGTVHEVWTSDNFYTPALAVIRNLAVYTPLVGRTIAIYADTAQSFLFVDDGNITQWRSKSDTPANVSQIAFDGIKFKVVDAGGGYVALWNVYRKRFLGINTSGTVECVKVSPAGDSSDVFDQKCTWEKFSITEIPLRKGLYTIYVPGPVDYSLGVEPVSYKTYGKKGQYRPHWQYELFSIHVVA
mmetsp:Transcript_23012/g.33044  ORF Transcript_23012/g.33044 Transcript_23012/m.33044 type:complete len:344 (+) Transcript_23012:2437-3468(+)